MSWMQWTVWIERFLFWAGTASITGSIATVLLLLLDHHKKWRNSRLFLGWIKVTQALYLLPITSGAEILSRIDYNHGYVVYIGAFGYGTTPTLSRFFTILGSIWVIGLIVLCIIWVVQYCQLKERLRGNVPVEDENVLQRIEKYRAEYEKPNCPVYMNDLLSFPITVGVWKQQIILPYQKYSGKELDMMLEHEMNHVVSRDLLRRRIGMFITMIHWWNPLAYILLNMLIEKQEIECDIRTCQRSDTFTVREYTDFLIGFDETENDKIFCAALSESKQNLKRRVEGILVGNKTKKIGKMMAFITGILMGVSAVIPAYAASHRIAKLQDNWIYETEIAIEETYEIPQYVEETENLAEDSDVIVIDLSELDQPEGMSTNISLDYAIEPNTRMVFTSQEMKKNDMVDIFVKCEDSGAEFRMGIICKSTNVATYITVSGSTLHQFTIPSNGMYSAYVQNIGTTAIKIIGMVSYSD